MAYLRGLPHAERDAILVCRQIILQTKQEGETALRWARQHEHDLTRQLDGAIYAPSHHTTASYLRADAQCRADLMTRWAGRRYTWQRETVKSFVARQQTFYRVELLQQEHPRYSLPSWVFKTYGMFKYKCPASFKCGRCKHALALANDKYVRVPAQYVIDLHPTIWKRGRPPMPWFSRAAQPMPRFSSPKEDGRARR